MTKEIKHQICGDGFVQYHPVKTPPAQQALDKKAENARELGLDYEPAQQEPWLLETTQTLAKNLAREFYPEVTQWECLNDLAGVISQIDNMTTGLMRKPAQQEPVAYLCENAVGHQYFRWKKPSSTYKPIALYTSPPAHRAWVGLTTEEIEKLGKPYEEKDRSMQAWGLFACAIEEELRRKNI
jgi:hypothetical protein